MTRAYLDYAASAPRREDVLAAMAPWMRGVVGNPSGMHDASRRARQALEEARDEVAELVGAPPGGVIFTGGGTESCHLAVAGVTHAALRSDGSAHLVTSAIEHHAVLDAAAQLARDPRVRVGSLPVGTDGAVDPTALGGVLEPTTALVSVMTANNETGVIQPVEAIAARVRRDSRAAVHTDAVAAAPWLDLRRATAGADLVSLCAHKLGGPVNAGALVVRGTVAIDPVNPGGGQERGRRGGTVDVAAAVGLAAALRAHDREREELTARVGRLRDRLLAQVVDLPTCEVTAPRSPRLAGTAHVTFAGVAAEEVLFLLDRAGVCASAGASCSSGAAEASHVLSAMGLDPRRSRGAVRLTLGYATTEEEVDWAAGALRAAVATLHAR